MMKAIWSALCWLALAGTGSTVEIIAHRGASADAPENTLAAVTLGWQQDADAVEIDIRLSADGQIVVLHDDTTKRTAGVDRKVADQTLEELKRLDAGLWKGPAWKGEPIPTLNDILPTIPKNKRLFIEIKAGPAILPVLEQTLRTTPTKPEQIVLIGFSYETMRLARQRFPQVQVFWLIGFEQDRQTKAWTPPVAELIQKAQAASFDGLNVSAPGPVDSNFVRQVKEAHLRLYVWTVNDLAVAQNLTQAGVNGITTDRPAWLREQLLAGP